MYWAMAQLGTFRTEAAGDDKTVFVGAGVSMMLLYAATTRYDTYTDDDHVAHKWFNALHRLAAHLQKTTAYMDSSSTKVRVGSLKKLEAEVR